MKKENKIILIFGIVVVMIAIFLFYSRKNENLLKVCFFDVGQGDSALIQTPFGQDILIDGGPDNTVLEKLGEHLGFFDNDIELMILTHPHADHVTGLIGVLKRYDVEKIIYTGIDYDSFVYKTFLDYAQKEGTQIIIANKKQKIILGDDLFLDILYPKENIAGTKMDNVNNSSVVARLSYGRNSFLFMGDAEREEELNILDGVDIKSDVLKLAHHGSKTNDRDFVGMVSPKYTVISVGEKNKFGHPNKSVINMLNDLGTVVFRTDRDGDINFFSNSSELKLAY